MQDRKHLRRLSTIWIKHPICFVTACTAGRRRLLDCTLAADILLSAWRSAPNIHGWVVGRYVIMPDHVHFFAMPQPEAKSLSDFMRDWKKWTARKLIEGEIGSTPIWQTEFFDHVLRSARSYSEKWDYVRENPVRAGLVSCAAAWPLAGECESLPF
jgi:putative transposase